MRRLAFVVAVAVCAARPADAEGQQVFRDEATFLAAVGQVAVQGFESYPTEDCTFGGSAPVTTLSNETLTVSTEPQDGGTSFLCVGTTSVGGPTPTDGTNALIAGSVTFDRFVLTVSPNKAIYGVGFYLTDVAEQGDALFSTNRGQQAVIAQCCGSGETVFFGFISDKPFKSFRLTNTGVGDGWGIDEVMLASGRKATRR